MIKTDTVARFSLIFARKVHFSENSSVRENFRQNLAETTHCGRSRRHEPDEACLKGGVHWFKITTTREPCTAGGELALAASTALP
jgi:hypothetical protein